PPRTRGHPTRRRPWLLETRWRSHDLPCRRFRRGGIRETGRDDRRSRLRRTPSSALAAGRKRAIDRAGRAPERRGYAASRAGLSNRDARWRRPWLGANAREPPAETTARPRSRHPRPWAQRERTTMLRRPVFVSRMVSNLSETL